MSIEEKIINLTSAISALTDTVRAIADRGGFGMAKPTAPVKPGTPAAAAKTETPAAAKTETPAATPEKGVTYDDLKASANGYITRHSRDEFIAFLKQHSFETLKQVPTEQIAAFKAKLDAA